VLNIFLALFGKLKNNTYLCHTMNKIQQLKKAEEKVFDASAMLSSALGQLSSIASEIYGEELQADLCGGGEIEFRRYDKHGVADDFDNIRIEDLEKMI